MSLICRVDHRGAYGLSAYPMLLSPILPLSFQAASPFLGGQVLGDKAYQALKTVEKCREWILHAANDGEPESSGGQTP